MTPIPRDDATPSVIEQAARSGWEAGYYDLSRHEDNGGVTWFNPGLVERPDGLWMLARRSVNEPGDPIGMNSVWALKLDETGRRPLFGRKLRWMGEESRQQFEDARAFYHPGLNQVGVSACTFKWEHRRWTGAVQCLGFFDANWQGKRTHFVPFHNNGQNLEGVGREQYQKNWLWWLHEGRLCLLYKSNPWIVAQFGNEWRREREIMRGEGVTWPFGEIRGGTPPMRHGDHYLTFFHSSLPWNGRWRRYYMGAIAIEAKPPFRPVMLTPEPLLTGSQNDPWKFRKPPCIFPCGAVLRGDKWLISAGINDLCSAWIELSAADVMKRLRPINFAPTAVDQLAEQKPPKLPVEGSTPSRCAEQLAPADERREMMRARMAKARAARGKKKGATLQAERAA